CSAQVGFAVPAGGIEDVAGIIEENALIFARGHLEGRKALGRGVTVLSALRRASLCAAHLKTYALARWPSSSSMTRVQHVLAQARSSSMRRTSAPASATCRIRWAKSSCVARSARRLG